LSACESTSFIAQFNFPAVFSLHMFSSFEHTLNQLVGTGSTSTLHPFYMFPFVMNLFIYQNKKMLYSWLNRLMQLNKHSFMLLISMSLLLVYRCKTGRGDSSQTKSGAVSYAKVRHCILYYLH